MITPLEALALPSAQLSPSDAEGVRLLLPEIDKQVRERMGRNGCAVEFPADRLNGPIIAEILRAVKRAGWSADLQAVSQQSQLAGGKAVVIRYIIQLMPPDSAYVEYESAKSGLIT